MVGTMAFLGAWAPSSEAQVVVGGPVVAPYRVSNYFVAPGNFGTAYGFASYGVPRTYTTFSAFPGPAYGTNYAPYSVVPGPYGAGLWRPGVAASGVYYGTNRYWSYPVRPLVGVGGVVAPPIGIDAHSYGPGYRPYIW